MLRGIPVSTGTRGGPDLDRGLGEACREFPNFDYVWRLDQFSPMTHNKPYSATHHGSHSDYSSSICLIARIRIALVVDEVLSRRGYQRPISTRLNPYWIV